MKRRRLVNYTDNHKKVCHCMLLTSWSPAHEWDDGPLPHDRELAGSGLLIPCGRAVVVLSRVPVVGGGKLPTGSHIWSTLWTHLWVGSLPDHNHWNPDRPLRATARAGPKMPRPMQMTIDELTPTYTVCTLYSYTPYTYIQILDSS